jgi:NAD(P)-dependent dehydrogenase (short-subunit alcohol dehydrogenase family)
MSELKENANKRHCAVVTGGTRGIGQAIAKRLINDGLEVIVTGTRVDADHPNGSDYYQVDFLNESSTKAFIEYIKHQPIDILINNAGINKINEFEKIAINEFTEIQKVNLNTPLILCQAVIPFMKKNNWGRIVNISSIWGEVSKEYRAAYSASKFGLDGMTASLAAEVASMGILANSVAPGFIDTDLTREVLGNKGVEEIQNSIPIRRLGKPSEIANFVSWLVSEENTYISGQNIMIDGGFSRV